MRWPIKWLTVFVGFGLLIAGCSSPQYRYLPSEHVASSGQHHSGEAVYQEPPNQPQGQVRILSSGLVTLKPDNNSKTLKALHLRMIFSNQSPDQTWTVNSSDQMVAFPNEGQTQPVFVNSDSNSIPTLQVRPHELRVWDLYFPLPEREQSASELPVFDFHWTFQAGPTAIAETTPFERAPAPEPPVAVYPYYPYPYSLGFGWGPYWGGPYHRYWVRVPG